MNVFRGGGTGSGSKATGVLPAMIGIGLFVIGQAASASKLSRLRAELAAARHAADHDSSTRLPNRAAAQRELRRRVASLEPTFVALLDLDGFKSVNDTYGHACGDDLLTVVAARLARVAACGGFAARLGGDEFLLLVAGAGDPVPMLSAVRAALAEPVGLAAGTFRPSASIGVTTAAGDASWRRLLGEADAALYQAKRALAGVVAYTPPSSEGCIALDVSGRFLWTDSSSSRATRPNRSA
jgi:diguanylate cyclase (GGDEF)-like protein